MSFEIDVPTPKGKYPVYPRMFFYAGRSFPPAGNHCRFPRAHGPNARKR